MTIYKMRVDDEKLLRDLSARLREEMPNLSERRRLEIAGESAERLRGEEGADLIYSAILLIGTTYAIELHKKTAQDQGQRYLPDSTQSQPRGD